MNELADTLCARRIADLLCSQPGRAFSWTEIQGVVGDDSDGQLRDVLARMVRRGLLVHTANGDDCYALAAGSEDADAIDVRHAMRSRVVMVVNNPATMDARVVKSAEAVAAAGYDTHVLGIQLSGYAAEEIRNGVTYHRVPLSRVVSFTQIMRDMHRDLSTPACATHRRRTCNTWARLWLAVHLLGQAGPLALIACSSVLRLSAQTAKIVLVRTRKYLSQLHFPPKQVRAPIPRRRKRPSSLWRHRTFKASKLPAGLFRLLRKASRLPIWLFRLPRKTSRSFLVQPIRRLIDWHRREATCRVSSAVLAAWGRVLLSSAADRSGAFGAARMWEISEAYFQAFYPKLCELDADIYHSHELSPLLACIWAARLRRPHARVVYDSHELEAHRNMPWSSCERWLWRAKEAHCMPFVDSVITVSNGCAEQLRRMYVLNTITVVRNIPWAAQEKSKTTVRDDAELSPQTPLIVYIGLASLNRGLEQMLDAMLHLPEAYHFATVGPWNAATRAALRGKAEALGLNDRFHILPKVPSTQLCRYIATADVSVLPIQNACLSYWHCMPNKLFESTLAGLPVVVSDFPDMRAFVNKHEVGETCNPMDSDSVAMTIQHVYENRHRYNTPEKAAELRRTYSFENEASRITAMYERLLTNKPARSI